MTAVIILTLIGVLLGLAIALTVRYFGAPVDPLAEQVAELMPGANCGACGFAGCNDYVQAMVSGKAKPGLCPSQSADALQKVCVLLGVASEGRAEKVAVVCCSGTDQYAIRRAFYNGVNDCHSAMLVAGGSKGCVYGCLGLGSCARACPFGAIEMRADHIAVVHPEICVGCGKCVTVCPRRIIKLVPKSAPVHVFCSSPEKAPVKRKVCSAACIGCRKCVKAAGENQMFINGFLASVNYENPPSADIVAVCPPKVLRTEAQPAASAASAAPAAPEAPAATTAP
ncbi:MAG: 4Fe-4S binding protein [Lentisphaerae bacterium]|jgi:electron transport complex protein RnfB|nr:4Fe-4S binding protein [Lentisphaerota bacterium]